MRVSWYVSARARRCITTSPNRGIGARGKIFLPLANLGDASTEDNKNPITGFARGILTGIPLFFVFENEHLFCQVLPHNMWLFSTQSPQFGRNFTTISRCCQEKILNYTQFSQLKIPKNDYVDFVIALTRPPHYDIMLSMEETISRKYPNTQGIT